MVVVGILVVVEGVLVDDERVVVVVGVVVVVVAFVIQVSKPRTLKVCKRENHINFRVSVSQVVQKH